MRRNTTYTAYLMDRRTGSGVWLKSRDGKILEAPSVLLSESKILSDMLEDIGYSGKPISLPYVMGNELEKLVELCSGQFDMSDKGLKPKDLVCTLRIMKYLMMDELYDNIIHIIAENIRDKMACEIGGIFDMPCD